MTPPRAHTLTPRRCASLGDAEYAAPSLDAQRGGLAQERIIMKPRLKAKNIKVEFHGYTVKLTDENDRRTTPEGVEIWIQLQPANNIRPMAACPDGSLEKFKHSRPKIVSLDWEAQ